MKIKRFSNHIVSRTFVPSGHRKLEIGEKVQPGDLSQYGEDWTLATSIGFTMIPGTCTPTYFYIRPV